MIFRKVREYVPQADPELRAEFKKAVEDYKYALDKFDNSFYVDFYDEARTEEMRDEYTSYASVLGAEVLAAKQRLDSTIKLIKISMGLPTHDKADGEKELPKYDQKSVFDTIKEREGSKNWQTNVYSKPMTNV